MKSFLLSGLSFFCLSAAIAAPLPFSGVVKGGTSSEWTMRGGSVGTGPFGEAVLSLTKTDTKGSSLLSYTGFLKPGERKQLKLVYRSNLANSSRDRGAWIFIVWLNNHGQGIKNEYFILKESANWVERTLETAPAPEGANRINIQIRVQERVGTLTLKSVILSDLQVREKKEAGAKEDTEYLKSLKTIAGYDLVRDANGKPSLKGDGETLPAVDMKNGRLPASFRLPERFCDREDLIYVVRVKFHYSGEPDRKTVGIFQTGRCMHGQTPNSLGLNLWQGQSYFARIIGKVPASTAQIQRQNFRTAAGESVASTLVAAPDRLIHFLNGAKLGETKTKAPFRWPKNQVFWIGAEDKGLSELPGEIESFRLEICKRPFELKLNGSSWRYGKGPHKLELAVEGDLPQNTLPEVTLTGVDGKQIRTPLKPERSGKTFTLRLPADLKFGYYELEAVIGDYRFQHSFVIVPEKAKRTAGLASPFAGCQGLPAAPEKQTPGEIEHFMKFLAEAGITHFRFWLPWDSIQDRNRKYHFEGLDKIVREAEKNRINLYVILTGGKWDYQTGIPSTRNTVEGNYPPLTEWSRHLKTVAGRYKGRVHEYQIWNEPETPGYFQPFDPKAYVDLLKVSYKALKEVDPKITVGLGGFCAALTGDYRNRTSHKPTDNAWGAAEFYALNPQSSYDVVDIHRYSSGFAGQSWDWHYSDMKEMKKYLATVGESAKPIWNSETGFVTGTPGRPGGWGVENVISMEDHAARAVQWYVQSLASGISRNYWYIVVGDECGLVRSDYSPYPAFAAYVNMVNELSGAKFDRDFDLGQNLRAYQFQKADGTFCLYAWTISGTELLTFRHGKSPVQSSDLWGNVLTRDTRAGRIGTLPTLFSSSAPMTPERMIRLLPRPFYAKGTPVTLEFELVNPADKQVDAALHLSGDGKALASERVVLAPRASKRIGIRVPEAPAKLELGVRYTGGIVYSSILETTLNPRITMDLRKGKLFHGTIGGKEQLHIGKEIRDDQNRVVTRCLWNGKRDLSADLTLSAAKGKLQFVLEVKDDAVVTAPPNAKSLYAYDSVELFLDQNLGGAPERIQAVMSADGRSEFYSKKKLSNFTFHSERTPDGYRITGSFDLPKQKTFGIDFSINDCDSPKTPRKTAMAFAGDDRNFASSDKYAVVLTE